MIAIFHRLTAFSVSITQKHPQKDETRQINLKTPQSKITPEALPTRPSGVIFCYSHSIVAGGLLVMS